MKTAIIIHGMPDKESYFNSESDSQSNSHWLPWLQQQLNINNILTQTPEMPEPYNPNYEKWENIFKQFKIDENTILIGHSCGGGFLLKYLSENNIKINKLILIAPWVNVPKEYDVEIFENLKLDKYLYKKVINDIKLFNSTDDYDGVQSSVEYILNNVANINKIEFHDKGHFCFGDLGTRKFPELLEEVLR